MLFTLSFRKVFVLGGGQEAVDFAGIRHLDSNHPAFAVGIRVDLFGFVGE